MPGTLFTDPKDGKQKLYFDLRDFEGIIVQGVEKLLEENFIPDALVGIPTGAWDALKRLSFLFPNALIGQFDVKAYSNDTDRLDPTSPFFFGDSISWRPSENGQRRPPRGQEEIFASGKILIVDDLPDSGWTLQHATPRIKDKCRKIFRSLNLEHFVVWYKETSVIRPRFYGMMIPIDPMTGTTPWIITPMDASCLRIANILKRLPYPLAPCLK